MRHVLRRYLGVEMNIFAKADNWANRIITWTGMFGLLSAAFTWLSSRLTPMKGFGWADFIAVGIASAVAFMLALAASLAAWRYFRPLPANQQTANPGSPVVEKSRNDAVDFSSELEKLKDQLKGHVNKLSTEILRKDETAQAAAQESTKIAQKAMEAIASVQRDMKLLFNVALSETTKRFCDIILSEFPEQSGSLMELPLESRKEHFDKLREFIAGVTYKVNQTVYDAPISNIIKNVENNVSNRVAATPLEKRPADMDHLLWRQYSITEEQANRIKSYIESQRWQMIQNLAITQRDAIKWVNEKG